METPWGTLNQLEFSDPVLVDKILESDKHQLVEGLIVECLFEQLLDNLPKTGKAVIPLDVETVIASQKEYGKPPIAFVWARNKNSGLGRYLQALEQMHLVFLIEYKEGVGFEGFSVTNGKASSKKKPLADLLKNHAVVNPPKPFEVDSSVKDLVRHRAAAGILVDRYRQKITERVLLPRIFINCGIQPWFKWVWNLDRVYLVDEQLWILEVKHKYPDNKSEFGLNNGEVRRIQRLADCGINSFYSILVKPMWTKSIGSLYMLHDLKARTKTAVIGMVLDRMKISEIAETQSGTSGMDTSINGRSTVSYKGIPVSEFGWLGLLSDKPEDIATKMVGAMTGGQLKRLAPNQLQGLRIA